MLFWNFYFYQMNFFLKINQVIYFTIYQARLLEIEKRAEENDNVILRNLKASKETVLKGINMQDVKWHSDFTHNSMRAAEDQLCDPDICSQKTANVLEFNKESLPVQQIDNVSFDQDGDSFFIVNDDFKESSPNEYSKNPALLVENLGVNEFSKDVSVDILNGSSKNAFKKMEASNFQVFNNSVIEIEDDSNKILEVMNRCNSEPVEVNDLQNGHVIPIKINECSSGMYF